MNADQVLRRLVKATSVPISVIPNYCKYNEATNELANALTEARNYVYKNPPIPETKHDIEGYKVPAMVR